MNSTRTDTKKWRIERVRDLLDSQQVNVEFSQWATDEMNELLGTAFDSFCKRPNLVWPNDTRHLHACFSDTWKDVSWKNLINDPPAVSYVRKAMRDAIRADLDDAFDAIDPKKCAICSTTKDLTCDHTDPAFVHIANAWISLRGSVELKDGPHGVGKVIADVELEADWISFHASRATYRIACRSCNAQKGARSTAWHEQYIKERSA
jgi:hypothetical protein